MTARVDNRVDRAVALRSLSGFEPQPPTDRGGAITVELPASFVDAVADRVAEQLAEIAAGSPWMDRRATAAYLGVSVARIERRKDLPSHLWDGRRLYNRGEVDAWMRGLSA